ncbi:MAG TPA: hypothetical protein VKO87_14750 [Gemmatimonadaceae bacterium]|nr:hypothetical protein [Gemmatimonadaceae bacterium]
MRSGTSCGALGFLALAAVACADQSTGPKPGVNERVLTARAPSIPTVPLVVTISDTDSVGIPYNIQSDGKGVYTDGVQDVQAVLDSYGTFALNTAGRRTPTRWVRYDFNNPVDPANAYRPNPSTLQNYHFSTGASDYSPFIAIQNLGVSGNPASECVYMGNSIANTSTSWRVSFHKGYEDVASSPTAFAVVTRTSVTPAVWTISPSGACSPVSNVGALRSSDGSILFGYYNLPFYFTLKAK